MRIVITGGPSSGKSTVIEHLKQMPEFTRVLFLPEVALMLTRGGYPVPDQITKSWQSSFQDAIYATQISLEASVTETAAHPNVPIIQDRGLLDGAAFFAGGLKEFEERYGISAHAVYERYDAVICLGSIAQYGADYFHKYVSKEKFHDFQDSLAFDDATRNIWMHHPNFYYVAEKDIEQKRTRVANIVNNCLV